MEPRPTSESLAPRERVALPIRLYVATFVIAGGSSLPFGVMDDLRKEFGFSRTSNGFIAAAAFIGALVSQMLLARFADRGFARRLVIAGACADALCLVGFSLASSPAGFVVSRFVGGLAAGALLPAVRSIVVRADPDNAAPRLGELAGFEVAGFVFAPVVGAATAGTFGVDAPFLAVAAVLIVLVPVLLSTPMPEVDRMADLPARVRARELIAMRPVLLVLLAAVALFLPVGIYDGLWQAYMNDVGGSRTQLVVSLIVFGLPLTALSWLGGRVVQRRGAWNVLRVAVWGVILATASYGVVRMPVVIIVIGGLESLVQAMTGPALQTAMVEAAPPENLAQVQGLTLAGTQVTAATVALVGAPVYDHFGPGPAFLGAALLMATLWLYVSGAQRRLARLR